MTFFNKKEDVLKIELTPYGRHLLSLGKLKPSYYAFYDDDILYDSSKSTGPFPENNSQIKTRILSETPNLKPQTNYKGVESSFFNTYRPESENILPYPIGTSTPTEEKANGWQVTFLHATASAFQSVLSSSTIPYLNIPQVDCQITYKMQIKNIDEEEIVESRNLALTEVAGDGTFIKITEEQVMVDILEKHGFTYNDSLNIEVYLYDDDLADMQKLKFFNSDEYDEDGAESLDAQYIDQINKTYVEYWLHVDMDDAIPDEDICIGLAKLKTQDLYLPLDVKCRDREDLSVNIYQSDVTDLEDCD
jgi:hypothetical protein